ncbi:MAG: hypothetical protein JW829_01345, partial [Pirellulales bacterium]|nr:hypothetical protein [Pirellulales bacterium]
MKIAIHTMAILGFLLVCSQANAVVLLTQDFESLALDPFVSNSESGGIGLDWTDIPPPGWIRDNTTTPAADPADPDVGPDEFFGWTFLNRESWIATAEDQDRSMFTRAQGTVMVADPDEYDDQTPGVEPDLFNVFITTPSINLTGVNANSVFLNFDSSFRPYDGMTGQVNVSFNGGSTFLNVLTLNSVNSGGESSLTRVNELISIPIDNPAGGSMIVQFGLTNAGNDWWWAVDNIKVSTDEPTLSVTIDRNTGGMTLRNGTSAPVPISGYVISSAFEALSPDNWLSIAENYDANNGGAVDAANIWSELTQTGAHGDLSEADLNTGTGTTLAAGTSINLGNAGTWIQNPNEQDIVFQYITNGQVETGFVRFIGNGGRPFNEGDLDFDGDVDEL